MKKTYHKNSNQHESFRLWHVIPAGPGHIPLLKLALKAARPSLTNFSKGIMATRWIILATLTATLATLIIGLGYPDNVSALTYQDSVDLDFTFNPALNLTITGGDLNIDGITPGNYHDSNIITVTSGSNSVTGYTLYANVGSSTIDYTDLRISSNNTNATNIFTSLSSNKGTLASFDGGTWGYSYSTDAGTTWISGDFDDPNVSSHTGYNGLPLYSSNSGIKLAKTTAPSNPSTIQFKIGAKASNTQASGTYTNTVNFISVGNVITASYNLSYVDTSNEATNMPNPTTGTTTNGIFTLTGTIPSRPDYQFKGWCTVNNSTNPTICSDGTNTGSIIEPNGQYVIGDTNTNFTGTVYAMWATGYMQNISLSTLAALMPNIGDTTTLLDSRDNQPYTIAKLADGKYWMTKNLNLAGGTTINCDTSDCENYIPPSDQGWQAGGKLPESSASDAQEDNYAYVYNSNSETCGENSPCYSYYSWDAVTLGSGRSIDTDNQNAPYSICPKGWKLPTTYNGTNSTTDFRALTMAYGGSEIIQTYNNDTSPSGSAMYSKIGLGTVPNYLRAGAYYGSAFWGGGSFGYYWAATSYPNNSRARLLYFGFSFMLVADSAPRFSRFSVRCLYDDRDITKANYLQEVTTRMVQNTAIGTTASLKDKRDEQSYMISKLADGNLWMLDNLALDPTALT